MAVIWMCGFEGGESLVDGSINLSGTFSYSTSVVRTGARAVRMNPATNVSTSMSMNAQSPNFCMFGFRVDTLPASGERCVAGNANAGAPQLLIDSTGALVYRVASSLIGTSTNVLQTGAWYWIGFRESAGTSVDLIQVNGQTWLNGTNTGATPVSTLGPQPASGQAVDFYYDDIVLDNAGFVGPSKVAMLIPTADSAVGTGWTLGTGTAISGNSGSTAVKNEPPVGVADLAAGSDPKQIRNAVSNSSTSYDATLTTYSAAGVNAGDTVLAVQPVVITAAPVSTQAKSGTIGCSTNPTITNVALSSGGTAGAFWSGTAAGTYPTGWKLSYGTITTSPSVTLGSAPVCRITQTTANTRIAMVCFMGMLVAWSPAVGSGVPYRSPYLQALPQ